VCPKVGLSILTWISQNEMFSPSGEYAESRPYKIFISLLDKWEIGSPLTETLVYNAFNAVMQLMQNPREGGEDVCIYGLCFSAFSYFLFS